MRGRNLHECDEVPIGACDIAFRSQTMCHCLERIMSWGFNDQLQFECHRRVIMSPAASAIQLLHGGLGCGISHLDDVRHCGGFKDVQE